MSHRQLSKKDETKIRRRFSLVKEHQVKDEMVYQQAFLLAIANKYFGFTIEFPSKLSQITQTLPHVVKIHFGDDVLDLVTFAEKQSQALLELSHENVVSSTPLEKQNENENYCENEIEFNENENMNENEFDDCNELLECKECEHYDEYNQMNDRKNEISVNEKSYQMKDIFQHETNQFIQNEIKEMKEFKEKKHNQPLQELEPFENKFQFHTTNQFQNNLRNTFQNQFQLQNQMKDCNNKYIDNFPIPQQNNLNIQNKQNEITEKKEYPIYHNSLQIVEHPPEHFVGIINETPKGMTEIETNQMNNFNSTTGVLGINGMNSTLFINNHLDQFNQNNLNNTNTLNNINYLNNPFSPNKSNNSMKQINSIDMNKIIKSKYPHQKQNKVKREIQEKSIQRRIKKNIIYFTQNLLIDLCRENGFFFNSIYARRNPKIFQVERIQEVFFEKRFLIDKNEMNEIGNFINNHLLQISNGKSVFIGKNDENIQFIFFSY